MQRLLLALSLLVALTAAFPSVSQHELGVRHSAHPCNFAENCGIHDFVRVQAAQPDEEHTFTVWTTQNNFAANCPSLLEEVADPESPKFGQNYSFDDIKALVHDQAALDAIHAYLDRHEVPAENRFQAPNGEYIKVTATVAQIEQMFAAKFHHFVSAERMSRLRRSEHYIIPHSLTAHVSVIAGLNDFPMVHRKTALVSHSVKRQSGPGVTPALISSTYNMPNNTDSSPKSDMSVFEALGQSFSPSDLSMFQEQYNLPSQAVKDIIGPNDPDSCVSNPNNCAEASLDVQYIMAIAQNAPLTYWSIPQDIGDIFVDFIEAVDKDQNPPKVFSISYGGPEALNPTAMMDKFNTELCKMGLRGITMFVASGDDGVAGNEARGNPNACGFNPDYPANCPFITTVGATMGPENGQPEVVCQSNGGSIITSGGGFSAHFNRPSYQSKAVSHYLQTAKLPPKNMFQTGGRAYPDVASLGNAYNVVIGGQTYQVSGTSASTPVFCAMVALVNGDREARGKGTLGFLNPTLYKVDKSVYNDITSGENNCAAGGNPTCCQYGFYAAKGWDATTGFGSLDFKSFANVLASL